MRLWPVLLLAVFGAGCVTTGDYSDTSDAARRRHLLGHWYDRYAQGFAYAQGDTFYRPNGTFSASYESVAPGASASEPVRREVTTWSGKWRVENGALIEDITEASDFSRAPQDRPLTRYIAVVDGKHLRLSNTSGTVNEYARHRPEPPKVSFTPVGN